MVSSEMGNKSMNFLFQKKCWIYGVCVYMYHINILFYVLGTEVQVDEEDAYRNYNES